MVGGERETHPILGRILSQKAAVLSVPNAFLVLRLTSFSQSTSIDFDPTDDFRLEIDRAHRLVGT